MNKIMRMKAQRRYRAALAAERATRRQYERTRDKKIGWHVGPWATYQAVKGELAAAASILGIRL